ncbi:MAG: efflux RND transporter periplasmic adaptor subunit, partial [Phenylobacterium sp.]
MRVHLVLIPLVAALALAGCHKAPPAKTTDAQQARAVRVVQVLPRSITGALAASGDLLPREEAAVLPEVSGY